MSRSEIIHGIIVVIIVLSIAFGILFLAEPDELRRIQRQYFNKYKIEGSILRREDIFANKTNSKIRTDAPVSESDVRKQFRSEFPKTEGDITDSISSGVTNKHELNLNRAKVIVVTCSSDEYLQMVLINPSGVRIDSAATKGDTSGFYSSLEGENEQFRVYFDLGNDPPWGKWTVEVINDKKTGKKAKYTVGIFYE